MCSVHIAIFPHLNRVHFRYNPKIGFFKLVTTCIGIESPLGEKAATFFFTYFLLPPKWYICPAFCLGKLRIIQEEKRIVSRLCKISINGCVRLWKFYRLHRQTLAPASNCRPLNQMLPFELSFVLAFFTHSISWLSQQ